jgi:hypothetical protein
MASGDSSRSMVFVSHANPEENELARWLTLQLANEGYPVWCDVTKLLGGEKFWENIQDAIAKRTVKFVFALSHASNKKTGTLDELNCALGVEKKLGTDDFIVTLKLDDLPYEDVYINIQRRNHIDFRSSWAAGLAQLFKRLKEDQIPTQPNFNPGAVCTWWRSQLEFSAEQGLIQQPDEHLSNWYPIRGLPDVLYRHMVTRMGIGKIEFDATTFPWPSVNDTPLSFLSFAKAEDFKNSLPPDLLIDRTSEVSIKSILERTARRGYPAHLTHILRQAWERAMARKKMRMYELSNWAKCYYFIHGIVKNDRLFFDGVEGKRTYRDIIGHSTRMNRTRYWHYGINAKPALYPMPHYILKGHVLFSNDAMTLWKSKDNLAKARRSQCKNWWNDEWRDRLLAVMTYLSNEQGIISIPVSCDFALTISQTPEVFESPVSYVDPEDIVKEEEHDDYALEEEDDADYDDDARDEES